MNTAQPVADQILGEVVDVADLNRLRAQYVDAPPDECWPWAGRKDGTGYGQLKHGGRRVQAHRLIYELFVGPIPGGLTLDHLCRNRLCVNWRHLEPVTNKVNILRGESPSAQHARQTHCINGHEFTPENTYTPPSRPNYRMCRQCCRDRDRRRGNGWGRWKGSRAN